MKVFHSNEFDEIIGRLDPSRVTGRVGVKVHFGERGCTTHLRPELAERVCDWVRENGGEPVLIECNVLYVSPRTRASSHEKLAREHGFDFAPVHILDGEHGDESTDISGCKVGAGIYDYDSLIVLSHFKGHGSAGFGGAVKNLGMGLGSRGGKLDMHATTHPRVTSGCIACGLCAKNCPADAITIDGSASIDPDKCIGCAMCISVCPEGVVKAPWGSRDLEGLQSRIRDYAEAIRDLFSDRIQFINVLENITANCDCMGTEQEPVMPDKGYLFSTDMHAIDLASLELTDDIGGRVRSNQQNRDAKWELHEID